MKIKILKTKAFTKKEASFSLTNRCNNNCSHCLVNLPLSSKTEELSAKQWCLIIEQLVKNNFTGLTFTGGEPTVHSGFKEIYLYAKKKGLNITLMTNATNFDEELKNILYKYPPYKIATTIYGVDQKTYFSVTKNKNGWQEFSKNVDFMLKLKKNKGTKLQFASISTKKTAKFYKEINDFGFKYSGKYPRFSDILLPRLDKNPIRNKLIDKERLPLDIQKKILLKAKQSGDFFPKPLPGKSNPIRKELFACKAGKKESTIYFFEDGTLSYCCLIKDKRYTVKLEEKELINFNFEKAKNMLDEKFAPLLLLEINQKCANCSFRADCYSCPARNLIEGIEITGYNKTYCIKDFSEQNLQK